MSRSLEGLAASAGGAALSQVVIVFVATMVMFAAVALVIWREATGPGTFVGRAADRLAAATGMPRWAALPVPLQVVSVVLAGVGVYWDVPYHYDLGRDEGPLANPSHYLMFIGLLGMVATGGIAIALARKPLPRRAFRLGPSWRVPYGAVVILTGAFFGFAAFPMDDVWHRMFGQDVTLWGPTHVLLLGGALFALLGSWLLCAEARQVAGHGRWPRVFEITVVGWVVLCLHAYLMEFDLGGPQFPLLANPVLLTAFAAIALVAARIRLPRGSLLAVFAIYMGLRLVVVAFDIAVGRSVPHIPLVLGAVLIVEAVALALPPARRRAAFAVTSGLLVGTLGVLAEFGWSHLAMPIAWPADLLAAALPLCAVVGVAGALAGAWLGERLDAVAAVGRAGDAPAPAAPAGPSALVAGLGLAAVFAACGWAIPPTDTTHGSATVTLEESGSGDDRVVGLSLRVHPADLADDATWFTVFSWQGGGIVREELTEVGDGLYRATGPVPAGGTGWKTVVRLHTGPRDLVALPVYLPADPGIPAPALIAEDGATVDFVAEQDLLRRETRGDVPSWMWTLGYLSVAAVFLLMLGVTVGLLARASRTRRKRPPLGPVPLGGGRAATA
ncbi:hypothetical protein [Streptomyces sp. URMC 129]|uniref:hypothetical protein n=1 Tax=Streptomyces sp. URMC 129 TaxID=3423407 RepID=UPI003F1D619D